MPISWIAEAIEELALNNDRNHRKALRGFLSGMFLQTLDWEDLADGTEMLATFMPPSSGAFIYHRKFSHKLHPYIKSGPRTIGFLFLSAPIANVFEVKRRFPDANLVVQEQISNLLFCSEGCSPHVFP